jgi:hypothetical protein
MDPSRPILSFSDFARLRLAARALRALAFPDFARLRLAARALRALALPDLARPWQVFLFWNRELGCSEATQARRRRQAAGTATAGAAGDQAA